MSTHAQLPTRELSSHHWQAGLEKVNELNQDNERKQTFIIGIHHFDHRTEIYYLKWDEELKEYSQQVHTVEK